MDRLEVRTYRRCSDPSENARRCSLQIRADSVCLFKKHEKNGFSHNRWGEPLIHGILCILDGSNDNFHFIAIFIFDLSYHTSVLSLCFFAALLDTSKHIRNTFLGPHPTLARQGGADRRRECAVAKLQDRIGHLICMAWNCPICHSRRLGQGEECASVSLLF